MSHRAHTLDSTSWTTSSAVPASTHNTFANRNKAGNSAATNSSKVTPAPVHTYLTHASAQLCRPNQNQPAKPALPPRGSTCFAALRLYLLCRPAALPALPPCGSTCFAALRLYLLCRPAALPALPPCGSTCFAALRLYRLCRPAALPALPPCGSTGFAALRLYRLCRPAALPALPPCGSTGFAALRLPALPPCGSTGFAALRLYRLCRPAALPALPRTGPTGSATDRALWRMPARPQHRLAQPRPECDHSFVKGTRALGCSITVALVLSACTSASTNAQAGRNGSSLHTTAVSSMHGAQSPARAALGYYRSMIHGRLHRPILFACPRGGGGYVLDATQVGAGPLSADPVSDGSRWKVTVRSGSVSVAHYEVVHLTGGFCVRRHLGG